MKVGFDDISSMVTLLVLAATTFATLYNTFKIVREMRTPGTERLRRLEDVERSLEGYGNELTDLKKAQQLNLRAQTVIIEHLTTGNHTDQLNAIKNEIQDYLIGHIGD